MSSELNSIYQAGFMGFMGGAVYGGFVRSRLAYLEFMENNQATAFKSHFEAKVSNIDINQRRESVVERMRRFFCGTM